MRVLISGAGVAGPTLAYFLSKAGAIVTIIEKTPTLLPHGQSIDIQGSAVTVIKKMGLMSEVRRFNTKENGSQFISPKGQPFAPFPVKEGTPASLTSEFEILRGDLAKVLYESSKDLPNVKYLFGTTVKEIISNNDNSVKVELSSGEVSDFDLLVAADGQWSKIRRLCFPPESIQIVDKGMYTSYFTIPRLPTDNDWWNVYIALSSRIVTLRPDPHGWIRAMFTSMPLTSTQKREWEEASKSDRKTQQELLRKDFADAGWQTQRLLDEMENAPDFYFHPIQQVKMTTWSSSRIVCLGDAAYAPSPLTGMGTSLAIVGAYILAGELSKLDPNTREHPKKALSAYETLFRPFVEESQKVPSIFPGIAHPATWWKRWLFQTFVAGLSVIVRIVVNTPWLTKRMRQSEDEDFPLPAYEAFDNDQVKMKE